MFKFSINTKELEQRFKSIANDKAIAEEVVNNLGVIALKAARQSVPVDTGALKQSLNLEIDKQGFDAVATIGTPLDYAAAVEFGTSSTSPQPYLKPALEQARAKVPAVVKGVWNKHAK